MHRRTLLSGMVTAGAVAIAGCSGGGTDGPAETVESYNTAFVEGDVEAANEEIYDDGEWGEVTEEDNVGSDIEILNNDIREVTASEAAEMAGVGEEEMTAAVEAIVSEEDADDSAIVYWLYEYRTAEGEEETGEHLVLLLKFDGEWLIYDYAPGGTTLR